MKKIFIIDKKDISTSFNGLNYKVTTTDGTDLIFTPEALEELISDYDNIRDHKEREKEE